MQFSSRFILSLICWNQWMVQQISLRLIKTRTHEFDTDFGILSDGFIKKRQATSEHIAIGKCFIYSLFQLNLSHLHLKICYNSYTL